MKQPILKILVKLLFVIAVAVSLYFIIKSYHSESTVLISDDIRLKESEDIKEMTESVIDNNIELPTSKLIERVPFAAQAPFGDWDDVKQDYGCEEASLLMAMHWVRNEPLSPEKARDEIIAISEFELENYQHHHDYSIADTFKVLKDYFGYENAFVKNDIGLKDIKEEIASGNLVIIPIDGMAVTNPYYTAPGPLQHQVVAIGYDDEAEELIVHDPGTMRGAAFRYSYEEIKNALMDYNTGLNEPIEEHRIAMLVIKPE